MGSVESSSPLLHAVIFPFMAKGHTLPLLDLARVLLHRHVAVTVFTTPANRPFVSQTLQDTSAAVIDLPFPSVSHISAGVESTDKLPSMSLFPTFATATSLMQPHFERALLALPRVTFIVSDAFLWWTLDSANKFSIPRFVFFGMSNYAHALHHEAIRSTSLLSGPHPRDELELVTHTLTRFPWIKLSKNDFDPALVNPDPTTNSVFHTFLTKVRTAAFNSHGRIINSFHELEPVFADYVMAEMPPKSWCVGPLCLAARPAGPTKKNKKPVWMKWLEQRVNEKEKGCVLYVAFGSQAEISREQIGEIAKGLEESMVRFLWVVREDGGGVTSGFEERVKERGVVIREWVDQREILMHGSVGGFLSHCGWNSVLESVCGGVPIVAWPMMAEQFVNAKMVEEEMEVGLRVETTCDGFVKWEGMEKTVREVMEGEKGRKARERVRELAQMARKAVEEGGSSWSTLDSLLHHA